MSNADHRTLPSKVRFQSPMVNLDSSDSGSPAPTTGFNLGMSIPVMQPLSATCNSGDNASPAPTTSECIWPTMARQHTNSPLDFNLGMSIPVIQPSPAPRFNFGMDIDVPAAPSPAPTMPKFNLGMNLSIPSAVPSTTPALPPIQSFNLGFNNSIQPLNLGVNLPTSPTPTSPPIADTTATQPLNLGFTVPQLPKESSQATTSMQSFDLGFGSLPATQAGLPQSLEKHVGYDINNKSFQFGCKPPTPIGQWQPVLIRPPQANTPLLPGPSTANANILVPVVPSNAASNILTVGPSTAPTNDGTYSYVPPTLPNIEGSLVPPTLASMATDAQRTAINILDHLQEDEFEKQAQMMVGGTLSPGDDIREPLPEEVLETNRVMLMAFCESRDRLTRIFKDLISLHHIAQVHEQLVPHVTSLLHKVEKAEAQTETDTDEEM